MKHVILRSCGYYQVVGVFDTYDEANEYRNRWVAKRRAQEDADSYLRSGSVSFHVVQIEDLDPELREPLPCVGCCEHG